MGVITLPWSMEQDRQNGVKANSVHVDDDFNTLLVATNKKLEQDGSIVPTADLPMGSHKITGLATPTANADAATKGYTDTQVSNLSSNCVKLTGDQSIAGTKTFTGTLKANSTIQGSINGSSASCTGNAATVTNGVYTTGNQTIGGTKTFSSKITGSISGNCDGNAGTVTNGVYTTGNQTIGGTKTFSSSPLVPNVGTMTDNSQKAASTKFVLDILKTLYPVGSIYMGTQSTCPLASLFGTWTRVPSGYAIWTGNGTGNTNASTPNGTTTNANYANANPNTTIAAGLPNIQATWRDYGNDWNYIAPTGAITQGASQTAGGIGAGYEFHCHDTTFKASDSNNIYGKSSTVQPQAYVVNVWRRTA